MESTVAMWLIVHLILGKEGVDHRLPGIVGGGVRRSWRGRRSPHRNRGPEAAPAIDRPTWRNSSGPGAGRADWRTCRVDARPRAWRADLPRYASVPRS